MPENWMVESRQALLAARKLQRDVDLQNPGTGTWHAQRQFEGGMSTGRFVAEV